MISGYVRASLKVLSALLVDFSAGLILSIPAVKDVWVLTGNVIFAIVCFISAVRIEYILVNYD